MLSVTSSVDEDVFSSVVSAVSGHLMLSATVGLSLMLVGLLVTAVTTGAT